MAHINAVPDLAQTPGVSLQAYEWEIVKKEFINTKIKYLGEGLYFIQEDFLHEIGEEIATWCDKIQST